MISMLKYKGESKGVCDWCYPLGRFTQLAEEARNDGQITQKQIGEYITKRVEEANTTVLLFESPGGGGQVCPQCLVRLIDEVFGDK